MFISTLNSLCLDLSNILLTGFSSPILFEVFWNSSSDPESPEALGTSASARYSNNILLLDTEGDGRTS